jgi:hypothetical protein
MAICAGVVTDIQDAALGLSAGLSRILASQCARQDLGVDRISPHRVLKRMSRMSAGSELSRELPSNKPPFAASDLKRGLERLDHPESRHDKHDFSAETGHANV